MNKDTVMFNAKGDLLPSLGFDFIDAEHFDAGGELNYSKIDIYFNSNGTLGCGSFSDPSGGSQTSHTVRIGGASGTILAQGTSSCSYSSLWCENSPGTITGSMFEVRLMGFDETWRNLASNIGYHFYIDHGVYNTPTSTVTQRYFADSGGTAEFQIRRISTGQIVSHFVTYDING